MAICAVAASISPRMSQHKTRDLASLETRTPRRDPNLDASHMEHMPWEILGDVLLDVACDTPRALFEIERASRRLRGRLRHDERFWANALAHWRRASVRRELDAAEKTLAATDPRLCLRLLTDTRCMRCARADSNCVPEFGFRVCAACFDAVTVNNVHLAIHYRIGITSDSLKAVSPFRLSPPSRASASAHMLDGLKWAPHPWAHSLVWSAWPACKQARFFLRRDVARRLATAQRTMRGWDSPLYSPASVYEASLACIDGLHRAHSMSSTSSFTPSNRSRSHAFRLQSHGPSQQPQQQWKSLPTPYRPPTGQQQWTATLPAAGTVQIYIPPIFPTAPATSSMSAVDADVARLLDWTLLMACAFHGHAHAVKCILADTSSSSSTNINTSTSTGLTPFMMAAFHGHVDVIAVLMADPRTDLTRTDAFGMTTWMHAVSNRQVQALEILAGIDHHDLQSRRHMAWQDAAGIDFVRAIADADRDRALVRFQHLAVGFFALEYYEVGLALAAKFGHLHIVHDIETVVLRHGWTHGQEQFGSSAPHLAASRHADKISHTSTTATATPHDSMYHQRAVPAVIANRVWINCPLP